MGDYQQQDERDHAGREKSDRLQNEGPYHHHDGNRTLAQSGAVFLLARAVRIQPGKHQIQACEENHQG